MHFTVEEDLLLISADGIIYLLDPLTGERKEDPMVLGNEFRDKGIVDAKLFENTLVLRNTEN